jgi:hypothetical protein
MDLSLIMTSTTPTAIAFDSQRYMAYHLYNDPADGWNFS